MDSRKYATLPALLIGLCLLSTVSPDTALAQRNRVWHGFSRAYPGAIAVGLAGGGNLNLGLNGPAADCNCDYDNGNGTGYHAGLHLDFFINRWFGLRLQGLYEDHSTEYVKNRTAELYVIDGGIEEVNLERRSEVELQYFSTSFSALWFTGPYGLYLLTGVGAAFYTQGTLKEEEYIITPGLTFPVSGSNRLTYKDGPLDTYGDVGLRASLLVGLGWDFPLGRGAAIAPELQADIPITAVMDGNADWRVPVLRASLALRFGL